MSVSLKLFSLFDSLGIKYQNYPHNPVMTCADKIDVEIPAPHTKNLFLKDDKGGFWLVSALEDTRIDFGTMAKVLQVRKLRFGSPESLMEHLGVKPGAVTMFALMNDTQRKVFPLIDARILKNEVTCFHPLHNEATTVIASRDLVKLIEGLGREYRILTQQELS